MFKMSIICVGKLKNNWIKEACYEYSKLLKRYCKLNIIEINSFKITNERDSSLVLKALNHEQELILNYLKCHYINSNTYIVCMCVEGNHYPTEVLTKKIENIINNGIINEIVFIIGGPYGLDNYIKTVSDLNLSISKLTFTHSLSRVMLLEQLYRIFSIINNTRYHK